MQGPTTVHGKSARPPQVAPLSFTSTHFSGGLAVSCTPPPILTRNDKKYNSGTLTSSAWFWFHREHLPWLTVPPDFVRFWPVPRPIRHGQLFDCRSFLPLRIYFLLVSIKPFLEAVPHVPADAPRSRSRVSEFIDGATLSWAFILCTPARARCHT